MQFQIISGKNLNQYRTSQKILLVDLRNYQSYQEEHIPGALWMSWEHAQEEIPLLITHEYHMHGSYPDWIALYCHSGRISLLVARELTRLGYPILSLHGGFLRWKQEQAQNCLLEFHHSL